MGAGWYIYQNQTTPAETEPIPTVEAPKTIIYSELNKEIDFAQPKEKILTEIKKEIFETEIEAGKIKNISLIKNGTDGTKNTVTSDEFLNLINSGIPDELKRMLTEDIGIYGVAPVLGGRTGGIILKTDSYQKAFAGMLNWEKGTMTRDLYDFLTNTTPTENILTQNFSDIVINNQDARMLNATNGAQTIIYGFMDSKTIVIAGSVDGFNEISARFKNNPTK